MVRVESETIDCLIIAARDEVGDRVRSWLGVKRGQQSTCIHVWVGGIP